jgi:hypothetical protein
MDANSNNKRFQFQIIDLLAIMVVVAVLIGNSMLASYYLPPIHELWPLHVHHPREEQNWIGQGGWAFARYAVLLVAVAYIVKWFACTCCKRRWTAVHIFSFFIALSLPYIWFLCVIDWFNPFLYRVSCWVGYPIAIWFVPLVSFVVDLYFWKKTKSLKYCLIRIGVEVFIVFPLWIYFWAFFSFFILGWGWI